MASAATVRRQIELSLEAKFPSALSPAARTVREVASTGVEAADRILEGGLPVGAISEIVGPACSGRTTLVLSFVAQRTAEGSVCAWVDVQDALDPESAAANGVPLKQLLWVRCQNHLKSAQSIQRVRAHQPQQHGLHSRVGKPWTRLDQALRATDLLLQAGGFAAIVLDLGDTEAEHGTRIPLATWFRFRQAADRTRCSLVLLGKAAFAQSSAALALTCSPLRAEAAGGTVLRGFTAELEKEKQRFAPGMAGKKKGPASAWSAGAAWNPELKRRA
ncbi:MAG TPA: recombinase RecA [Terracidiphilus sp.]